MDRRSFSSAKKCQQFAVGSLQKRKDLSKFGESFSKFESVTESLSHHISGKDCDNSFIIEVSLSGRSLVVKLQPSKLAM